MTGAEPRYEAHLACGDTVSAYVLPEVGKRRFCIHCDASKVVAAVTDTQATAQLGLAGAGR